MFLYRQIVTLSLTSILSAIPATFLTGCAPLGKAVKPIEDQGTKPPSLDQVLQQLELGLSRVRVLVPSSLLLPPIPTDLTHYSNLVLPPTDHWTALPPKGADGNYPPEVQHALDILAYSQCFAVDPSTGSDKDPTTKKVNSKLQTRNPLVPISTGPLQLQVQGQLSLGGTLTVSLTPSIAGTATRQTQQQIMLPLTMVSLITLPSFYAGQQMANIQYAPLWKDFPSEGGITPTQEKAELAGYLATGLEIAARLTLVTNEALKQYDINKDKWCDGKTDGGGLVAGAALQ
jgi:hypothetical protein